MTIRSDVQIANGKTQKVGRRKIRVLRLGIKVHFLCYHVLFDCEKRFFMIAKNGRNEMKRNEIGNGISYVEKQKLENSFVCDHIDDVVGERVQNR